MLQKERKERNILSSLFTFTQERNQNDSHHSILASSEQFHTAKQCFVVTIVVFIVTPFLSTPVINFHFYPLAALQLNYFILFPFHCLSIVL